MCAGDGWMFFSRNAGQTRLDGAGADVSQLQSLRQVPGAGWVSDHRKESRAPGGAIWRGQSFGGRHRRSEDGCECADHDGQARGSSTDYLFHQGRFAGSVRDEAGGGGCSHQAARVRAAGLAVLEGGFRADRAEVRRVTFSAPIGSRVAKLAHIRKVAVLFCMKDSGAVFPDASPLVAGLIRPRPAAHVEFATCESGQESALAPVERVPSPTLRPRVIFFSLAIDS